VVQRVALLAVKVVQPEACPAAFKVVVAQVLKAQPVAVVLQARPDLPVERRAAMAQVHKVVVAQAVALGR
jgi:hypothetical protein